MRLRSSVTMGALAAAVLAHGLVYSACHLNKPLPIGTYQGFFQFTVLTLASLWSRVQGLAPLGDLDRFGRWFAVAVPFACPAIGFILYCLIARRRVGWNLWKPLLVAALSAPLNASLYRLFSRDVTAWLGAVSSGVWTPWAEAASAALVFMVMVWTLRAGGRARATQGNPV